MKKLMFICREGIFTGQIHTKMAELVDSLANALNNSYEICVLTTYDETVSFAKKTGTIFKISDKLSKIRFSKVTYYLIEDDYWLEMVPKLVEKIRPDIIHNMAEVEWIELLQYKPDNFVFTFNYLEEVPEDKRDLLKLYNYITTTSETYFESIKNDLNIDNFYGITNGLLTEIFSPSKGLLLSSSYGANSLKGKEKCKKTFLKLHNIKGNPCIYLVAGLRPEPNLKDVIDIIPLIKEQNGLLVIATKSNVFYEIELDRFKKKDGVIYFKKYPSLFQIPTLLGAADYYIHPSSEKAGNLLPLIASNYGAIPILSLDSHNIEDDFNNENSILVEDNLSEAILTSFNYFNNDKETFEKIRKNGMNQDYTWKTRKQKYIEIYEKSL